MCVPQQKKESTQLNQCVEEIEVMQNKKILHYLMAINRMVFFVLITFV